MDLRDLAQKIDWAFPEYTPDEEVISTEGVRHSLSRGNLDETGCRLVESYMPPAAMLSPEEREFLAGIAGFARWEDDITGEFGYVFFHSDAEMDTYWGGVLAAAATA